MFIHCSTPPDRDDGSKGRKRGIEGRRVRGHTTMAKGDGKKKKTTTTMRDAGDDDNDCEAGLAAFKEWMQSKNIALNGVDVGRFRKTGRGAMATRDLDVGEIVVSVPDGMVLTSETSAARARLEAFVGEEDVGSPRLEKELLVMAVMAEMCAGEKSKWGSYLRVVYDGAMSGHSVLAWTDEECARLAGTDTWRDAYERDDDETLDLPTMTDEHWENVVEVFFEQNPELMGELDVKDLRELHFAATAMVAGYSFTLGDDEIQGMVPFWDMLNHAPPHAASVRLNHDVESGTLQMITVKKVAKGEEVFNTYGPLRNAELLRRYGFVLSRNPHGGTTVGLADVIEAAMTANPEMVSDLPLRLAWLESRGLADDSLENRFFVHQTGRPSGNLLIAMRVLTLKTEEMTALIETDFEDEEQLMMLEGNDEQRAEQSYMVGAALQFLGMHCKMRYDEPMKASRLTVKMYDGISCTNKNESVYRAYCAAVVRLDEQVALTKLGRWTYHPSRSEDALLHAWPYPIEEEDDEEDAMMVCEPVDE